MWYTLYKRIPIFDNISAVTLAASIVAANLIKFAVNV